ncbi:MAG: hypothetical protein RLZZ584_1657 [Pseudomonadota bacterium]
MPQRPVAPPPSAPASVVALAGLGLLALVTLGALLARLLVDIMPAQAGGAPASATLAQGGNGTVVALVLATLAVVAGLALAGAWRLTCRSGRTRATLPALAEPGSAPPPSAAAGASVPAAPVLPATLTAPAGTEALPAAALHMAALAPLLTRLIEALPGRALLVWRAQVGRPWQLVQVHDVASQGSAHVLHPLGPPYPDLAIWLASQPQWPGAQVITALAGGDDHGVRVLPLDGCTAVVWLEPAPADVPPAQPGAEPAATADSERETFLYTVSHDLRAPIRVIEGFTRIVKEDYGTSLDRVGNDHLDRVLGASARMTAMIDALLGLSRLSTRALQREAVDLSMLAGQVLDELRRQSPERQAEISIEPGLVAQGDPALLHLVLDNLLGNAWKYSARRELTRISFGAQPASPGGAAGRRIYTVTDNGAGFDMRFAERLFGPFQRLHSASEFAGTGIGLATVRRIVRRHGGDVWADAAVDHGANFHFTLD